jgi:hypothetical protein
VPIPPKKNKARPGLVRARDAVDERKRAALERVERERQRRGSVRLALGSIELDRRTGGSLLADGLAYRLFLWLLPYGLFVCSLFRLVTESGGPSASSAAEDIGMGTEMASTIESASEAAGQNAVWLLLLATILILLAWSRLVRVRDRRSERGGMAKPGRFSRRKPRVPVRLDLRRLDHRLTIAQERDRPQDHRSYRCGERRSEHPE